MTEAAEGLANRHMANPVNAEYSLCGEAYDGEDGTDFGASTFAKGGEIVTCEGCRAVIRACKTVTRSYRLSED